MEGNPDPRSDGDLPRQYVLHALRSHGGRLPVEELLEELFAWEQHVYGEEPTAARRTEIRRWLLETYLPQLRENGVVEYDETERVVEVA